MRIRAVCGAMPAMALVIAMAGCDRGAEDLSALARWQVGDAPALRLDDTADSSNQFFRIAGVGRTASGGVVVANGGSSQIRVFDSTGSYLRSFGGQGKGPGEFERMSWIGRSGDSVFIYDHRARRMSIVSAETGFISSEVLAPQNARSRGTLPMARFGKHKYFVWPLNVTSMRHAHGTYRDSIDVGVLGPSLSDSIRWLGTFPNFTHLAVNPDNAERAIAVGIYPFGPSLSWAVVNGELWMGDSDTDRIFSLDENGTLTERGRVPWRARRFNEAAFDSAKANAIAGVLDTSVRSQIIARYDRKFRPTEEPRYGRFIASVDGDLWVERFRVDDTVPPEYIVLNAGGQAVARISLPASLWAYEVGRDYVLGVVRDDNNVESVVLYRVARAGPPTP